MRKRARLEGSSESFKCGLEEIIRVCQGAHQEMVAVNARDETVLRGIRRNGMCQYRVNVDEKRFEDCDLDDRFQDMPTGGHRLKDEWLANRKDWLDDKGRPIPADWNRSEQAREMEDLAEFDYCSKEKAAQKDYTVRLAGKEIKIPVIDVDADEQTLFSDKDAWMNLHPKLRKELMTKFAGKRSDIAKKARAAQKKVEREKVKMAISSMQEDWKEWVSEAMVKSCRKELVKTVVPMVKPKKQGQNQQKVKGLPKMGKDRRKEVICALQRSLVDFVTCAWL